MRSMTAFPAFAIAVLTAIVSADKEQPISVSDSGEGSKCDADLNVAKLCLACTRLPQEFPVKLTDCCTDDKAYEFCDVCVKYPEKCLTELKSLSDNKDMEEKRWGTLFMGGGGSGGRYAKVGKRYGRVFFGKRPRGFIYGISKKYDPYMGQVSEENPAEDDEDDYLTDLDKRYGKLFTGSRYGGIFNKRFGSVFFGKSRPRSRIWDK